MLRRAILLGSAVLALTGGLATPARATPLIRVDADTRFVGERLPRSFLGVSQEYRGIEAFTGNPAIGGVNGATVGFMRQLARHGGGAPVLRVGGFSSDDTFWNPNGGPKPLGVYGDMHPRMLLGLEGLAKAVGGKLLLGLNFANADRQLAVDEARAIVEHIPSRYLLGLELGNEPNLYPTRPMYFREDESAVYARKRRYGPRSYAREVGPQLRRLSAVAGDVPLAGPAISPDREWVEALPRLLRRQGRRFDLVTAHGYPLGDCDTGPDAVHPDAADLLANETMKQLAVPISLVAKAAKRRGRGMRLSESNSIACGGTRGVSDALPSSLWGIDHLFAMWLVGAQGVDFHAASATYRPFGTVYAQGAYRGYPGALYYGMLAFAEASAGRARLLPSVVFGSKRRRGAEVSAWATLDRRRRTVRVMLVNKEFHRGGRAVVRVRGARSRGRIVRLRSTTTDERLGITWAGRVVPDGTLDGQLAGRRVVTTVHRRARHRFRVSLPRHSAALLTVKVRRLRR